MLFSMKNPLKLFVKACLHAEFAYTTLKFGGGHCSQNRNSSLWVIFKDNKLMHNLRDKHSNNSKI